MTQTSNRVLSCIQPTAEMHIGNYFGAVKHWVELQDSYNCLYGIVDLHAMTMPYKPEKLLGNIEMLAAEMMACGIDPEKSILFVQSLVPEHTELCWIFSCICSIGDLKRMTQFKDKSNQLDNQTSSNFVSAGLFNYPVLQAADILIYRADKVPVGKDQEQHLELSREIARDFNRRFGFYFPEPAALFTKSPKIMSPADPESKMSKSLGEHHFIGLFEDEKSIRKKIKSAVTDSGDLPPGVDISPGVGNLLEILKACGKTGAATDLRKEYDSGTLRYVALKEAVADAVVELTGSLREKRDQLLSDVPSMWDKIHEGSKAAREIARETISQVRDMCGLPKR